MQEEGYYGGSKVSVSSTQEYPSVCVLLDECLGTIALIDMKLNHTLLPSNPNKEVELIPDSVSEVKYKTQSVLRALHQLEQRIEK